MNTFRPLPSPDNYPHFTVYFMVGPASAAFGNRWTWQLNCRDLTGIIICPNTELTEDQVEQLRACVKPFTGLKLTEETKLSLRYALDRWAQEQVQTRQLYWDYFEGKWLPW
jgi:hypothetical protein